MLELKELINIISPQKLKNIKVLGGEQSKVRRLFYGINDGKLNTEQEVINELFSNTNHPKQAFADIKRAIKKELVNTLFIINLEQDHAKYSSAYVNCYKNYAAAKILIGLWVKKSAFSLAAKTLKKAIFFEFTELAVSLARELQLHHAQITNDKKKHDWYSKVLKEQHLKLRDEIQIQSLYTNLIFNLNKLSDKAKIVTETEQLVSKINFETLPFKSYKALFYSFCIIIIHYELLGDYEKVIDQCNKAIFAFKKKPYPIPSSAYLYFYSKSIPVSLQLKDWKKAHELIKNCLSILSNKTFNYHAFLFYQALLGFHSQQYQIAYEALLRHKEAKLSAPHLKEHWRMIEAWIMLFVGWKKIERDPNQMDYMVFNVIRRTPIFSKDKKGKNAAILILKYLYLLQNEAFEQLYDMAKPFKLYAHRYLKSKKSVRTYMMVRTLCALAEEGFDKKLSLEKATPYYEKLKATPFNFLEQRTVEIVPFEMVIEIVFDHL